jgi:hypothetical protein
LLQVDAWDPGQSNPMNNTWPCRCARRARMSIRQFCPFPLEDSSRMWLWVPGRCSPAARLSDPSYASPQTLPTFKIQTNLHPCSTSRDT